MREGTTRSRTPELIDRIEKEIDAYASECDSDKAAFMRGAFARQYRHRPYSEVEQELKALLSKLPENRLRLEVLSLLASYSYREIPWPVNKAYRLDALELARSLKISTQERIVLLMNYRYASSEEGEDVDEISDEINQLLSLLDPQPRSKDAEVVSRDMSFRGKLLFREAEACSREKRKEKIESGIDLYNKAIYLQRTEDHLRVNLQIELCEFLLGLLNKEKDDFKCLSVVIQEYLDLAYSDLGSHPCSACRGYYYRMRAQHNRKISSAQRRFDHQSAIESLKRASCDIARADAEWKNMGEQHRSLIVEELEEIKQDLKYMTKPRRIFLSHAGANKGMVRRHRQLLETLRYEPWMDERDMKAGATLLRAILDGLQNSCAAVFFITDEFKDERWIAQEIDYAIDRKINDDSFSIITLVFRSDGKEPPRVPDLLRRYVWKDVYDEIEGMKEIIEALPLAPTIPIWR
jgi:hypothetical protein